jgi:hypothetical protein
MDLKGKYGQRYTVKISNKRETKTGKLHDFGMDKETNKQTKTWRNRITSN